MSEDARWVWAKNKPGFEPVKDVWHAAIASSSCIDRVAVAELRGLCAEVAPGCRCLAALYRFHLINGGLATDIVSTALARAGYATDFEQVPWARAMLGIGEGRYDVLINAWYSEERTHIGRFSAEYLLNRVRFIKRKDEAIQFDSLPQLRAYPIAVVRGYAYSKAFDEDPKMQKVPVHNFAMAVRMLAADRVKLTLEDEYVARYYLARESPTVRSAVEFLPSP